MSFYMPGPSDWAAIALVALALIVLAHQEAPMIASQPRRGPFAWIRSLRERHSFTVWGADPDDPGFFGRIRKMLDDAPEDEQGDLPRMYPPGPVPFGTFPDVGVRVFPAPEQRDQQIVLRTGDYTRRGRHRQTGEGLREALRKYGDAPLIPERLSPDDLMTSMARISSEVKSTRVELPCTQPQPLPGDPSGQKPPWETAAAPQEPHQWEPGDSSGPPTIVMKVLRPEIEENIGKYVEGLPKYGDQQ